MDETKISDQADVEITRAPLRGSFNLSLAVRGSEGVKAPSIEAIENAIELAVADLVGEGATVRVEATRTDR